jgi:hypothetical protein
VAGERGTALRIPFVLGGEMKENGVDGEEMKKMSVVIGGNDYANELKIIK